MNCPFCYKPNTIRPQRGDGLRVAYCTHCGAAFVAPRFLWTKIRERTDAPQRRMERAL